MSKLTVVSTFVVDIIVDKDERVQEVRQGGPAYFFDRVFKQDRSVKLVTGQPMAVKIKVVPGEGEFGQVMNPNLFQRLPRITTPNLLISTLVREWCLSDLIDYQGRVFLDVQGFVRDPASGFGKKKVWDEIESLAPKLFCVKANDNELQFLPKRFVEDQKQNRCLVVTYGSHGSHIYYRGNGAGHRPEVLVNAADTLGAGDTYFATLVKEFIKSGGWYTAGEAATEAAVRFLQAKG